MAESVRRLFFALWPPTEVVKQLHEAAQQAHRSCGGRAMRADTLHLTLVFLGAVPASRFAAVEAAADAVAAEPFVLELDRLACWKHNRIVWAGCEQTPEALRRLAEDLAANLSAAEFSLDTRPFAVHATLVRNADCKAPLPALAASIRWQIDDFALVESHTERAGARYEIVRRWAMH